MAWPFYAPLKLPDVANEIPDLPIYRLSVERYHAMIEHGILTPDDPLELLEGWLVRRIAKSPRHSVVTGLLSDELRQRRPAGWHEVIHRAITLADSEPEPDVSVIRGTIRDYHARHPGSADTGLVVEIADGTLGRDRGMKKRIYAAGMIPTYWIVNIEEHRLEVYTNPTGPGSQPDYSTTITLGPGDEVALVLDGQEIGRIPVATILP